VAATRIGTFDEWVDYFYSWQKEIGVDFPEVRQYKFEAKFGDLKSNTILHGFYRGQDRWKTIMHVPDQRIRDGLLNMIVYQGDTEFASVEQQRHLFETAPDDYERQALARVMREEMRHGFQMCHLLVKHFGRTGKIEAQKQLERRSFDKNRLLGSFNEDVNNWLDFYVYTQFIDRDGKFQLNMLSQSAFLPLAQSMLPMLKEEAFHLGTGNNGLIRIVKAGRIPIRIIQKYFNRWLPTAYDLFGTDHSASARWAYTWGIKGRYDEDRRSDEPDLERINEGNRELFHQECAQLTAAINRLISEAQPKLYTPDLKFNRRIGIYANQPYSVDGRLLTQEEYEKHLAAVLPTQADEKELAELTRESGWIEPKPTREAA
jgi:benzoyl-CoA 2,3-epoxidase subunit B